MNLTTTIYLSVSLLCMVVATEARCEVPAAADRPNILFIFTDDHASAAIGAYGSVINQTPNLDRIANRNAFMASRDTVEMPDDFVGHVMVFRTFDKVSYALVMNGIRPISQGDVLKHPDAAE